MTENGLKEGDWVRIKRGGEVCRVTCTDDFESCVMLVHDAPVKQIRLRTELERIDRRTAFLTELKGLLERYDARIYPYGYEVEGLGICFGDNGDGLICYNMDEYSSMGELNAGNIMDFEKD